MSEFDELLSEVLAADVCVDSPDGMERRITAVIHSATQQSWFERRSLRAAIAAVLLIGFAGMLAVQYRDLIAQKAGPGEERSSVRAAAPSIEFAMTSTVAVSSKKRHRRRWAAAVRSEEPVRRVVVSLASLKVQGLMIQPIEVASLASDNIRKESLEWGKQR